MSKTIKVYGCTGLYEGVQEDSCGSGFSEREATGLHFECLHCCSKLEYIADYPESECYEDNEDLVNWNKEK